MDRLTSGTGTAFSFCFLIVFHLLAGSGVAETALIEPVGAGMDLRDGGAVVFRNGGSGAPPGFFELELAAGVRFDKLRWSIAGNRDGRNPNILSELTWSDVLSHQLTLGGRTRIGAHVYGRGHVSYAWIESGTVRDSDYAGDNRTQEYSRSVCETKDDFLWDIDAGLGYPFWFPKQRLFLSPMAGVSLHRQSLRITDGYQVVSEDSPRTPPIGPLDSRLNSLYTTTWRNFWLGGDLRYEMASSLNQPPPMAWEFSLKYIVYADYSAEADWNLRGDLQHPVSFAHEARGRGVSARVLWLIRLARRLEMRFALDYIRLKTDNGTDRIYTADGPVLTTRLNEVLWQSNSIALGLTYRF